MTQMLLKPNIAQTKDRLFRGLWLRWGTLNTAERFVCANVALISVWWVSGLLEYMPLFILIGITVDEWRRYGTLRLKRPSLAIIALFAFFAYEFVDTFLLYFDAHPSVDTPPDNITLNYLIKAAFEFSLPCLVWYIQSNKIRVRLEVVAWACSIVVVQMIIAWIIVQFAFPTAFDNPPRSLYGILTGKSTDYSDGLGKSNYLLFYDEDRRFGFFFGDKQTCAAFLGFVGLLALDLRNRFWTFLLLAACVFLIILPEARSAWVALPAAAFVHLLLKTGKAGGAWLLLALIGLLSFGTLSVPPITNSITRMTEDTASSVGEYRAGSTEARSEIYHQTLTRILDKPLFGHKVSGIPDDASPLDGGGAKASKIGTHSVILGRLLYQDGLVGTGLFATFWISLIIWLYDTRTGRPICWFPILLFFTLMSSFTFLHYVYTMCTLLCLVMRRPVVNHRNAY